MDEPTASTGTPTASPQADVTDSRPPDPAPSDRATIDVAPDDRPAPAPGTPVAVVDEFPAAPGAVLAAPTEVADTLTQPLPAADDRPPAPPPTAYLERDDMAWPPAPWERTPGAWRDDVWTGPPPFQPYAGAPSAVAEAPSAPPAATSSKRLAREIVETAVLTLLIFLAIKLVVQNFRIQGASMETTLHDGQFLLVNRLPHYGIGEPKRGDILVFKAWDQGTGAEERDFIKRVIGLPGETVEIHDNQVYINNEVLTEPYLDPGNPTTDRIGPITLSPDEYYVMGDNRGNSSDSRTYGPLDKERIIGKAWLSYWPPGEIGLIPDSQSSYASTPAASP